MISEDKWYLIRAKATGEYYIYAVGDRPLWTEFPILARRFKNASEAAVRALEMALPAGTVQVVPFRLTEMAVMGDERVKSPGAD